MERINYSATILAGALIFPQLALAHHSASNFDTNNKITLEGTIVRYEWKNPHVYVWLAENPNADTQKDTQQVVWEIEGQPPSMLRRMGWTQETLKIGDRVTVTASADRNPEKKKALLETLHKADNTLLDQSYATIFASLSKNDATEIYHASGINGTWATLINYQVIAPLLMPKNTLQLTEKGLAAVDNFNEAVDSPSLQCNPGAAPGTMLAPDVKVIEVSDDAIVMRSEFSDTERVIHLNQKNHNSAVESNQGHSIGHWEGRTLVVDTTHFAPYRASIAGLPSGNAKHIVEKFTLSEDGSELSYSYELEDPEYLAAPVAGNGVKWIYRPDLSYKSLPCDIENAQRFTE